jgi:transposase
MLASLTSTDSESEIYADGNPPRFITVENRSIDGMSRRAAAAYFGINRKTVDKMLGSKPNQMVDFAPMC